MTDGPATKGYPTEHAPASAEPNHRLHRLVPMLKSRLPIDFVCIGAQKAGTSWLNLNLKRHERVFVPFVKETFYLNLIEEAPQNYPVPLADIRAWFAENYRAKTERHIIECYRDSVTPSPSISLGVAQYMAYLFKALEFYWHGLDRRWYDHLYSIAQPGSLRGDITPDYSLLGDSTIDELARSNPDLKVVLITRDPVERDISQLKMELLPASPRPTIEECIGFLEKPSVTTRSDYPGLIRRWSQRFGGQLLTLPYSMIRTEPNKLIDRVCHFLGIPAITDRSQVYVTDNATRCTWTPPQEVLEFLRKRYGDPNPIQAA